MSRPLTKSSEKQLLSEFKDVTGASQSDAAKFLKKFKNNLALAVDAYFNDGAGSVSSSAGSKDREREKKLGDVWEKFKDTSDSRQIITIDGTMELCQALDVDPSSDSVLFCLAADLGSKATGEWEKEPWVAGWMAMPGGIDSLAGMKARLPALRKQLNSDPAYFKKVYMHTFDLVKNPGARSLVLDTAIDMWNLFITPALKARPSALSRIPAGEGPSSTSTSQPPAFAQRDLDMWLEFQKERGKAVSKDTWSLFVDFIRSIDTDYKEYDEEAAWPSTIDDFVAYARKKIGQ